MDAASIKICRGEFDRLASANEDVTVDMRAVQHIDGAGIGALVYLLKRVRETGHELAVINLKGQPLRLFNDLGMAKALGAELPARDERPRWRPRFGMGLRTSSPR
jgi:anti-anti-sigma factor